MKKSVFGVLNVIFYLCVINLHAATLTVTTSADNSGSGTLRSAIASANAGDTITFAGNLSGASIVLTNGLTLSKNVTIDATTLSGGLQINGNGKYTVLTVNSNVIAVLNALTITNGLGVTNSGSIGFGRFGGGIVIISANLTLNQSILSHNLAGSGGGIYSQKSTLVLNQCMLSGNSATNIGGGICSDGGTLTINTSTFSGNSAGVNGGGLVTYSGTNYVCNATLNTSILSGNSSTSGGGIMIMNQGTLAVNACTLSKNIGTNNGGGILNDGGMLTVSNSTLVDNSATANDAIGGGICNLAGSTTINTCTFSGNSAAEGAGGGICNYSGTTAVKASTLSENIATYFYGGGIFNDSGTITLTNSIIAGNTGLYSSSGQEYPYPDDIDINSGSTLTYGGLNLVSLVNNSGTINNPAAVITNSTPNLAALGNYGGSTQTMLPLPGSPAIDAGSTAANSFNTDQRGLPRISGTHVDIGAVEVQQGVAVTLNATGVTATGATLNGTVMPNDLTNQWYFEYGVTINYGSFSVTNTLVPGINTVAVSNAINNLAAETTYHYRLYSYDGVSVKTGGDQTLTTLPAPVVLPLPMIINPAAGGVVNGQTGIINGTLATNQIPAGSTAKGVYYSLNGGTWTLATTTNGWSNWSASVTFIRGTNILAAYATDSAGSVSSTNTITFYASFTTLYSFEKGNNSGSSPFAGLIQVGNRLYGTTANGGSIVNGTVFAINTDGTEYSNVYNFTSAGVSPFAGLVLSGNMLYGATANDGVSGNSGRVFTVNTNGSGFADRYIFTGSTNGANPYGTLVLSGNRHYGTTRYGGVSNSGTVFAVNTDGSGFTNLYRFTGGADGSNVYAGLILSGSTLYGTTVGGGTNGYGTVFAVNTDGNGFTNLYSFTGGINGANPYAGLMLSGDTLYDTTAFGGAGGQGTVFAVNTDGSGFSQLYAFSGTDGANPYGGLMLSGGTLYGTTANGGENNDGALYAVTTNGSSLSRFYSFSGADGQNPWDSPLLIGQTLYGTTVGGGAIGWGTVFAVDVPVLPTVSTSPATVTGLNSVTLNGMVNPNGTAITYYFQYGTTMDYGSLTMAGSLTAGNSLISVSNSLTGLATGTQYYYRLVASNSTAMTVGAVMTFTTGNYDLVLNTNDSGAGSLRGVLALANSFDTVIFTNTLSSQTILLTSGQLTVSGLTNLTIDASSLAGGIAVNGNQNGRIFYISGNAGVTVNNLTVTNGYVSGAQGGGIYIDNNCNLTLNDCLISGNTTADQDGGGILNNGTLTVNQSLIVGNLSGGYGGGGIRNNAGTAILNQSTLANNINNGSGGGGIHNAGSSVLTLNECTFSGNSTAGSGGGIFNNNSGTVTVNQSTFSGNTANSDGGGIWGTGSSLNIFNSVVAGNSGGGSVNISGSYTGSGVNVTSGTVNLAPLGNYGGLTPTMPPLVGATNIIDQGSDTAINLFATDQRGLPRRSGAHVDIGAVEAQLAGQSPILVNEKLSSAGIGADEFQFGFTNSTGKDFTVYGSTNITLPFAQWQYLGRPVETPAGSGEYHFFDLRTATNAQSFYRVTSP